MSTINRGLDGLAEEISLGTDGSKIKSTGDGTVQVTANDGSTLATLNVGTLDVDVTATGITKSMVGLGNCDNTSDANKPVSTAQQTALDAKLDDSQKGTANGLAELDSNSKVPAAQLPSYVDDVLEYANLAAFPATGEDSKIYVAEDTNKTYRWSGSAYVEISESLALGETSSTAYAGDKGAANALAITAEATTARAAESANATAIAANTTNVATNTAAIALKAPIASPTFTGTVSGVTSTMVGLGNCDNTADSAKPISTATQTALDAKAGLASANEFTSTNKFSGNVTIDNGKKLILDNSGNGEVANTYADDAQVYHYNGAGITIGSPYGKINSIAFADQNKADRNLIRAYSIVDDDRNVGMHYFANQADTSVPSFSVTDGLVGVNNAQPAEALDVTGNIAVSGTVDGVDIAVLSAEVKGHHVDITDSTTTANVGAVITAGSYIESCSIKITEAFTGGSSPTIIVGDTNDTDGIGSANTSDIGTLNNRIISNGAVYSGNVIASDMQPIVTVTGSPTAGAATVVITTRAV